MRYLACREAYDNGTDVLKYCPTTEMMVGTLSKPSGLNEFIAIQVTMLMTASELRTVTQ